MAPTIIFFLRRLTALALAHAFVFTAMASGKNIHAVERVSNCGGPHLVWHVKLLDENLAHCQARLDAGGRWSQCSSRVPLVCDTNFDPRTATIKQLESWAGVAEWSPECYTVAVAGGPGMRGVRPINCIFNGDVQPEWGAGLSEKSKAGIVALRASDGRIVGTGIILAPNLVLASWHVVKGLQPPVVAVSGHELDDLGRLSSVAEESGIPLLDPSVPNVDYYSVASSPEEELDFYLIRTASNFAHPRADLRAPSSMQMSSDAIGDSSQLRLIGFSSNPFFPRGKVLSTLGRTVPCPSQSVDCPGIDAYIHHNLQTTPGFSGAPLVAENGSWIGTHQRGLSVLDAREALKGGAYRNFEFPNRAVRADKIVQSIAVQLGCGKLRLYAFTPNLRAWMEQFIGRCVYEK